MPCYDPRDHWTEEQWAEEYAKEGRWDLAVTKKMLSQWLCDALRGNPPHPHCLRWWEAHKRNADNTTGEQK